MIFIDNDKDLAILCEKLALQPYFAIDTEFIRERTFWPQLCLIQIAAQGLEACVDALAGLDMTPLFKIMNDKNIVKVFHSARQDLEIFYNLMGKVPENVFDTQVAAMVCGLGEMVSYQNLCLKVLGINLDKSQRFTDWSHRPLTDKQIEYALYDVTYLLKAYEKILADIKQNEREEWIKEDMLALCDASIYEIRPEEAWKRLKTHSKDRRFLAVLRELALWREIEAERVNRPRRLVLKDEHLLELAATMPKNREELAGMRGFPKGMANSRLGTPILAAIKKGMECELDNAPEPVRKRDFPKSKRPLLGLLELLLAIKSEEERVAGFLIASVEELEEIALFQDNAQIPALMGWRRELFGNDALALCHGKLSISYDTKKQRVSVK